MILFNITYFFSSAFLRPFLLMALITAEISSASDQSPCEFQASREVEDGWVSNPHAPAQAGSITSLQNTRARVYAFLRDGRAEMISMQEREALNTGEVGISQTSLAETIIQDAKPFIKSIIRQEFAWAINMDFEVSDLVAFGQAGAWLALRKFDPDLGNNFSSYLTSVVKEQIRSAIADDLQLVRLPDRKKRASHLIRDIIDDLLARTPGKRSVTPQEVFQVIHDGDPSSFRVSDDLMEELKTVEKVAFLMEFEYGLAETRRDQGLENKRGDTVVDLLVANSGDAPLSQLEDAEDIQAILGLIAAHLNDQQRVTIKLVFGLALDDGEQAYLLQRAPEASRSDILQWLGSPESLTQEQASVWMDVSRSRVGQIVEKALKKLKHPLDRESQEIRTQERQQRQELILEARSAENTAGLIDALQAALESSVSKATIEMLTAEFTAQELIAAIDHTPLNTRHPELAREVLMRSLYLDGPLDVKATGKNIAAALSAAKGVSVKEALVNSLRTSGVKALITILLDQLQ